MRHLLPTFLFASMFAAALCHAQTEAVINDPDGYTNVRSKPSADAPIVARVNKGEVFTFTSKATETFPKWVAVRLASGKTGYMHSSRVLIHGNIKDLADTQPGDEINVWGKGHGIDYYPLARAAARGEEKAMLRYFAINDTDGAAAETHFTVLGTVVHLLGDKKFAAFLQSQTSAYRASVLENMEMDLLFWPFEPREYLKRNFPLSAQLLLNE